MRQMGKGSNKRASLNPTDAFRKQQRNREKKRNKQERRLVREEVLLKKNPHLIKEDLTRLNHLALLGKLDQVGYKRREKLELMWELIRQKAEAEKKAKSAHLEGILVNEDAVEGKKKKIEGTPFDENDSQSSFSESSDSSLSEDDPEEEHEDIHDSLTEAPPLPPGLPPLSHLSKSSVLSSGKNDLSSTPNDTASIPIDFSQLVNPEKPLLPPPPPPLFPEGRVSSVPEEGLGLTVLPPLPPGPPPIGLSHQRAESLSEGHRLRSAAASSAPPMAIGGLPMPIYPPTGGPPTFSHPMFSYSPLSYIPAIPSPMYPHKNPNIRPSGPSFEGFPPKRPTDIISSGNSSTKPVEVTPVESPSPLPPPSASPQSNISALFVPTQLRIRNKDVAKRNRFTSQKISSISQVTSFSTGIHRAGDSPFANELTSLTEVIEHSAAQRRENKSVVPTSKPMETKDIDQAFNDFLKEVEKV
ncbi:WW domain binding protein 11 [Cardiosporidium cionae]|uniref:WW domain binding protein 11 n=1 Tax=Cardiosporidium cionae TaxID=476202 RepID=A0ABQ7JF62_9APIC|nr:WW domain binding protein 11 [Cardiosporidium cionae]|eukprot:KAF8822589.1 WW domain binding protein 11 [Cardiosporidium cionae]